jgi:hypothetical protein
MPYGNLNVDTVTTSTSGGVLGAGNASLMKNRIINGDCRIDQRNSGASVSTSTINSTIYTLDRYYYVASQASKFTIQQNAGSVTPPSGFTYYSGLTSTSAYTPVSSDLFIYEQKIEGYNMADWAWGTASAKPITFSFWVYSSLTGTFSGSLRNVNDTRNYAYTYTINAANTWEQKTITIAGDTTGTWNATNNAGLKIGFCIGAGSTYLTTAGSWGGSVVVGATGSVNLVSTSGATFYITGVQLEVGSSATGFEYRHYQQELALCQRYCEVIKPTGAVTFAQIAVGQAEASTSGTVGYFYQTAKRAAPTVTYDTANKYAVSGSGGGSIALTSISTARADTTSLAIGFGVASGLTGGNATRLLDNNANNPITIISVEL